MACSVCNHPDRAAIDAALLERQPAKRIAATFGAPETSIRRHRRHRDTCLGAGAPDAPEAAPDEPTAPDQRDSLIIAQAARIDSLKAYVATLEAHNARLYELVAEALQVARQPSANAPAPQPAPAPAPTPRPMAMSNAPVSLEQARPSWPLTPNLLESQGHEVPRVSNAVSNAYAPRE